MDTVGLYLDPQIDMLAAKGSQSPHRNCFPVRQRMVYLNLSVTFPHNQELSDIRKQRPSPAVWSSPKRYPSLRAPHRIRYDIN